MVVVAVAVPVRLTAEVAGLVSAAFLIGASGEVAGSEGADMDSAEGVAGASSGWATGAFSISDMAYGGVQRKMRIQRQARRRSANAAV